MNYNNKKSNSKAFTTIYLNFLRSEKFKNLSTSAKILYIYLKPYSDLSLKSIYPSVSQLEKDTGFNKRTIYRSLEELIKFRIIVKTSQNIIDLIYEKNCSANNNEKQYIQKHVQKQNDKIVTNNLVIKQLSNTIREKSIDKNDNRENSKYESDTAFGVDKTDLSRSRYISSLNLNRSSLNISRSSVKNDKKTEELEMDNNKKIEKLATETGNDKKNMNKQEKISESLSKLDLFKMYEKEWKLICEKDRLKAEKMSKIADSI